MCVSFYSRTASSHIVIAFYASNIFPRSHLMMSRFAATAVPMRLRHWATLYVSARHVGMRAVSRKTLMLQIPMKSTPACVNAAVPIQKTKLVLFGFSAIPLSAMLGPLSQAERSAQGFRRKTPRAGASNALFVLNFAPMMTNCPPTMEMAMTLLQLILLVHPALVVTMPQLFLTALFPMQLLLRSRYVIMIALLHSGFVGQYSMCNFSHLLQHCVSTCTSPRRCRTAPASTTTRLGEGRPTAGRSVQGSRLSTPRQPITRSTVPSQEPRKAKSLAPLPSNPTMTTTMSTRSTPICAPSAAKHTLLPIRRRSR